MQQTQIQYFNETFHTQFHLSLVKRVNRSKSSYKAKLSYFDYLIFFTDWKIPNNKKVTAI